MSDRSRRSKERFDYKILHHSGCKVAKTSDSEIEWLSSSFENISIMANINKFKEEIDMIDEYI